MPSAEPRPAAPPAAFAPADPQPDEEPLRRPRREPRQPADGLAIAALVVAIAGLSLLAVVLGHLALGRIRARGTGGRRLAVAALALGYAGLVLFLAWWAVYFAVLAPIVTLPG
ncbi:DUF4190 domain-containing protein [Naasia sp. SYSU D00057]|uniref:DUF4190 domain-containing protein n=1 Tax=Naasia sp. SYSU D00057 TaxID=2817380 RepID=UPI0027DC6861|nr:DUF4190 domain-containing protein [Naasia sp. SYSU D00057]